MFSSIKTKLDARLLVTALVSYQYIKLELKKQLRLQKYFGSKVRCTCIFAREDNYNLCMNDDTDMIGRSCIKSASEWHLSTNLIHIFCTYVPSYLLSKPDSLIKRQKKRSKQNNFLVKTGKNGVKTQKSTSNRMSNLVLIEENKELSHIY